MSTSASTKAKHALYTALALTERIVRPPRKAAPSGLRNFLLLQYPDALGTAIHATPVVAALRAAVPEARIAVAAGGFGAEVFRNNPAVDLLLETAKPKNDLTAAVRDLRSRNLFAG